MDIKQPRFFVQRQLVQLHYYCGIVDRLFFLPRFALANLVELVVYAIVHVVYLIAAEFDWMICCY